MAGRYVPPHLRRSIVNGPDHDKVEQPPPNSGEYTIEDLTCHYQTYGSHGTINRSEADPTHVTHILVFKEGHPEWPPNLYCKTNLDVLEHYYSTITTITASSDTPDDKTDVGGDEVRQKSSVPVFTAVGRHSFDFLGYYVITSVTFLEPRSEALVNLLEAKFNQGKSKERRPDQWKGSLAMRWAVVMLEQDKAQIGKGCGVVKIPPKSVTERLQEMRLRDKEKERTKMISRRKRQKKMPILDRRKSRQLNNIDSAPSET
ncbi:MAG: hypothetical protein M1816_007005 [Peltula sp. TS41687]|nr:MAG: hypothetical protein M1816_007005 [Peltula sp. TS41687]